MDMLPPSSPSLVIVQRAQDRSPLILIGFVAVGSDKDMQALEDAAQSMGLSSVGYTKNDRDETEIVVIFPPGTARAASLDLYHQAKEGRFGALQLGVMTVPLAAASDGIDMATEASVSSPSFIEEPRP